LTGALKNFVGINGLKDYLPHHRKGGSGTKGDCYEGRSLVKRFTEEMLDATNRTERKVLRRFFATAVTGGYIVNRLLKGDANLEGSWHGNDTIWRTCLDLLRILHYGQPDARLAAHKQRKVISITDAIIAGEGEGPLSPIPVPFGAMTLGFNVCAAEWVNALLMGFDPQRIALTRESFSQKRKKRQRNK